MNLESLAKKLRSLDSITPNNPNITALEHELIAKNDTPVVICAVMVLLFLRDNELHLTLIQRPTYEGTHSGQIAFAGGKKDKNDKNLLQTAIRECIEEIGVEILEENILGALNDIYIIPSHSLVTPFVAYLPQAPSYIPSEREVAKMLEIKLTDFMNPQSMRIQAIKVAENKEIKLPAYLIDGHNIWGATGRMIKTLLDLLP
jgi:8-oxo-dGTP pyrophosphatase MutT (NUDIX family)